MRRFEKLVKKGPKKRNIEKKKVIIIIAALIGVILAVYGISSCCPGTSPGDGSSEEPEDEFGGDFGGCYTADAKLLNSMGGESGSGTNVVEPASSGPEVMFSDDFETGDLSKWSASTNDPTVTTENAKEGDYSCKIDNGGWNYDYIHKNDAFEVDEDEDLHAYFFVYISSGFDMDTGEVAPMCRRDHFVFKVEFDGEDDVLVYLIGGRYSGREDEVVIDIRDQVSEQGGWVGIEVEDIQNDYLAQFEDEMPEEGDITFQSWSRCGYVFIDDVIIKKTPVPIDGGYWEHEGTPVECYFVDVDFKILISEQINESDVWAEIKIWVTIFHEEETAKEKTLLQESLVNITVFDEWINWTSSCYDFPEDNGVYGSPLLYMFDICIEVFGQIEDGYPDEGSWVSTEACSEGFDSFTVNWVGYDGYIIIIIAGAIGGAATVGVIGARKLRKKEDVCECKGQPDCDCAL
jgi:hypothetical protein